jgi:CBS domain-containing protein
MGPAVVIRQDTTLREVARLMLAHQVQGVLVVNDQAEVVGVVTERQLTLDGHYLRQACAEVPRINGRWVTTAEEVDAACLAAGTLTAHDVMERRLTGACPEELVGVAVERMLRRDVEFAVVHDGTSVVGMLGSRDLLRQVAGEPVAFRPSVDKMQLHGQPVHVSAHGQRGLLAGWLLRPWN